MKFHNGFIGHDDNNSIREYYSGDHYDTFLENLKTQPNDWYYKDVTITYKHNNNGHRCKNIDEIDLDNYILFTGCSHTEGVGLELEKTYPYLVAENLKCDYYNLAASASGLDVIEHNIIYWLTTVPKKPKAIVIQWSDHTRFLSMIKGYESLIPHGTWTGEEISNRLIVNGELSGAFHARKILAQKNIWNVAKQIPVIEIIMSNLVLYNSHCLYFKTMDRARDLSHAGIKSHQDLTNQILSCPQLAKYMYVNSNRIRTN